MVDLQCQGGFVPLSAAHREEARQIAKELAAIARSGQVLAGTITERTTRCGRSNCACHGDPPKRHGPYWQWTRKVAARTVSHWLNAAQAGRYQSWVDNDHRLHELVSRLESLARTAVEEDLRQAREARGAR